jgi:hypothetical protein
VNSCTFNSLLGFKGNASTMEINTNFIPAANGVNHTLNDAGWYVYVVEATTTPGGNPDRLIGVAFNSNYERMRNTNGSQNTINVNSSATLNASADLSGTGMKGMNRTSSTDVILYNEKTQIVRTQTSGSQHGAPLRLFRSAAFYGNARIGFTYFGAALTQSENNQLVDAYNAFLSKIS